MMAVVVLRTHDDDSDGDHKKKKKKKTNNKYDSSISSFGSSKYVRMHSGCLAYKHRLNFHVFFCLDLNPYPRNLKP